MDEIPESIDKIEGEQARYWQRVYDTHKTLKQKSSNFKQQYEIPITDFQPGNVPKRGVVLPEISSGNQLLHRNKRAPEMMMSSTPD